MLVGIHANIMNTLMTKKYITKVKKDYFILILIIISFISSIIYLYYKLSTGFLFMIVSILSYLIYAQFIFNFSGKMIDEIPVIMIVFMNYALIFSFRYLKEERQKKIIGNMFSTMVSPEVLE